MDNISIRRTMSGVAMLAVATLALLTTGVGSASAVAGDSSNASARYLGGALFANVLPGVVDLSGSAATSNGTGTNDVEQNNLNLTALGALNVTAPGGLNVPLHIANAGVLSQYAAANTDGSALAAAGLVANDGTIGVANVGAGTVPGPLTFTLSDAVGNSGLGAALTNEVANLSLDVGAVSSRAALDGPPSQRSYELTNLGLNFTSPAVASLVPRLNTQIGALQTTTNGLSAALKAALGGPLATVNVSTTTLATTVAADLTGTRSSNGVTIDLASGNVTVDLSRFATLNGQAPNTNILTTAQIAAIASAITGLVTSIVAKVGADLQSAINAITVQATIAAPITGTQLVTINTTVGNILAGSTSGITILGGAFTLAGVLGLLAPVVAPLGGVATALNTAVAVPVNALIAPAVNQVFSAVLRLTVNAQSSSGGADSVTALRVGLLPGLTRATTADLGTSTVGPNVQIADPTITAIAPNHGSESGGTSVTLTGTGLNTVTSITIGGTTVAPSSQSTTSLTFVTPAHASGAVTVTANAPQGNSGALAYTYDPVASATSSLAPSTGPDTGGTNVTITGTGFIGATGVTFDGIAGTGFTVLSPTQILVTSPAHAVGPAGVIVIDPAGNSTSRTFAYTATPTTATSLSPATGPEEGGQTVTITGTNLTDATGVTFDGVAGTAFTHTDATHATVVSPAHAPATVPVIVTNPAGDASGLSYTFTASASTASSLAPTSGPDTGATLVTITGSGFFGATGVTFGGVAGTGVTVLSGTQILVTTPAHLAGAVNVIVQNPAGNSAPLVFTYTPTASTELSLTPTTGPEEGGQTVTITGTNLNDATGVTFGGVAGTAFTVVDATHATVRTPAHSPATVPIVLVNPAGNGTGLTYTYLGVASAATGISPASGPETGGTGVTITGTGFSGATGVTFDGVAATDFTVVSNTTITATTPADTPGTAVVIVQDPAGDSDPVDFMYTAGTTITTVAPGIVPEAGGVLLTINGTCFVGATAVIIGGITITDFTVNPAGTQITVTAPAGEGSTDVTVVGSGTCGTTTLPAAISYVAAASVAVLLTPGSGPETGHTLVTITGHGFTGATGVTFDGVPGISFTVVDDETITVRTPVHDPGAVDVIVLDPEADSPILQFTYTPVSNGSGSAPGSGNGSGSGGGTSTAGGPLAFTGVRDATEVAIAAIVLLASGVVLVLVYWRRRKHDTIR